MTSAAPTFTAGITFRCPVPDCPRMVGPYAEKATAMQALREHINWRHRNFQRGGHFPPIHTHSRWQS